MSDKRFCNFNFHGGWGCCGFCFIFIIAFVSFFEVGVRTRKTTRNAVTPIDAPITPYVLHVRSGIFFSNRK
jgi:hypothetical protein